MYSEWSMKVLAIARLCGVSGSDKEILRKYEELFTQIRLSQEQPKPEEPVVFKRPF